MTRALFAFAEMTNMDPEYSGPEFDFDKIIKELMNKVTLWGKVEMLHSDWLTLTNTHLSLVRDPIFWSKVEIDLMRVLINDV